MSKQKKKPSNWRGSKRSEKGYTGRPKAEGILKEKRTSYKGPNVGAANYDEFLDMTPIEGTYTLEEALEIRKRRRKEANKARSMFKKYEKAFYKGKSQMRFGKTAEKTPNIITISSNEYDLHKKV